MYSLGDCFLVKVADLGERGVSQKSGYKKALGLQHRREGAFPIYGFQVLCIAGLHPA